MHAIDFSLKWRLPSPDAQLLASHCRIFRNDSSGSTIHVAPQQKGRRVDVRPSVSRSILSCCAAIKRRHNTTVSRYAGSQSLLHKVWRLGNYEQRTLTSDLMTLSTVRLTAASAAPARDPPCFPHANISNCKMRGARRGKLHPCPMT